MEIKNVENYLAANRQRFIDGLLEYVRFPSVSAQPAHKRDLSACAQWLAGEFRKSGLSARLCPTPGNPILIATTPGSKKSRGRGRKPKPHFLVYGHYDVQPAEPFDLWHSKPFEPRVDGKVIRGRGASDNKGQNWAHLKAVEAYIKTGTELPCDITFIVEGEEEVGSGHLAGFLTDHRRDLACDAVVISDTGIPSLKHPALTYALRGVTALEITLKGPSRDLHSGIFGGSVDNPAMALCQLLGRLRDKRGRITVPGFYDDVAPLSAFERKQLARVPFSEPAYRRFLGVRSLFGESGFTPIEQRSARPTLEINGLTSGYQGDGSKTIVPALASAKITCRLVPNQTPKKINAAIRRHLKAICPDTVRIDIESGHGGEPYLMSPDGPAAQAAVRALKKAFRRDPVLLREGGSIPIVTDFKRILGADTLLIGLALPDDNAHSPNEKFSLDCFSKGMSMAAYLWQELSLAPE